MLHQNLEKGKMLVADPRIIGDAAFTRAIILITEHNNKGSVGFIVNKPMPYTLNDLVPDIDSYFTIYNGGPVEQDNLYFVHNVPELIPDSIEISNGLFWGGDFEITKKLIQDSKLDKSNIRFFLGYSGWEPNQLENEYTHKSWLLINNIYNENLFSIETEDFWSNKIKEFGGEYLIWSNAPENPILN